MSVELRRGVTFVHPTMLDTSWKPGPGQRYVDGPRQRMVVTRATSTTVWFGPMPADGSTPKAAFREDRARFVERYGELLASS